MSGSLWKNIKILILIQMPARQGKVFCFHYSIQCCRTPMPSCEFLWPHNGWITPTTAQIYATWNIFPTYLQNTENISNLASDTRWKYLQAQQFHVSNRIFFHFHYCKPWARHHHSTRQISTYLTVCSMTAASPTRSLQLPYISHPPLPSNASNASNVTDTSNAT